MGTIVGKKFGNLTVLEELNEFYETKNRKERLILCKCDCGTIKKVRKGKLLSGQVKSCGCLFNKNKQKFKKQNSYFFRKQTKSENSKIWNEIYSEG